MYNKIVLDTARFPKLESQVIFQTSLFLGLLSKCTLTVPLIVRFHIYFSFFSEREGSSYNLPQKPHIPLSILLSVLGFICLPNQCLGDGLKSPTFLDFITLFVCVFHIVFSEGRPALNWAGFFFYTEPIEAPNSRRKL